MTMIESGGDSFGSEITTMPGTLGEARQLIDNLQSQLVRYNLDLKLASEFQRHLMLKEPKQIPGYDIGIYYNQAGDPGLGGDVVSLTYPLEKNESGPILRVFVGDAVDKGPKAALIGALVLATLQSAVSLPIYDSPKQVLIYMNQIMWQLTETNLFTTGLYGLLYVNGLFTYARAGHEQLMVFDAEGNPVQVELKPGQPLGISESLTLDTGEVYIMPGGLLVLRSDGLSDETDPELEILGNEKLIKIIQKEIHLPAAELALQIEGALCDFQGGTPQADDHSLVVIKREY